MKFRSYPLLEILNGLTFELIRGSLDVDIEYVTQDSREVRKSTLFVAVKGLRSDGHDYIDQAIDKGATVIGVQDMPSDFKEDIVYIQFQDSRISLGKLLSAIYRHPSHDIKLVGVTGTNGKTSVATMLFELFMQLGYKCGLISTVENRIMEEVIVASHTTPDPDQLHRLIYEMKKLEVEFCFMEVSSHAQSQHRTAGLKFSMGIFTNLTHDHLDYHGSFKNYLQAKKSFFDNLTPDAIAISNLDDKNGAVMLQNTKAQKRFYSLWKDTDYKGHILSNEILGLHLKINQHEFHSQLVGRFNASNLLAVFASGVELDQQPLEILTILSAINAPTGRFETIQDSKTGITGIVDYAHTPDALKNVLETIADVKDPKGRIITIVGCGGERDKKKRPIMAEIAYKNSDMLILTSDNPRTEDPESILNEMESGLQLPFKKICMRIQDRQKAIYSAVNLASKHDVILVAGKGHETYQEINGIKYPFDDREELKAAFHQDI